MVFMCDTTLPRDAEDESAPVREALAWGLRPLCRSLACCTWCSTLEAVSTVVRLADEAAQEQLLCTVCQQLADEFGLNYTIRRAGDVWAVRFFMSRGCPVATAGAMEVMSRPASQLARFAIGMR